MRKMSPDCREGFSCHTMWEIGKPRSLVLPFPKPMIVIRVDVLNVWGLLHSPHSCGEKFYTFMVHIYTLSCLCMLQYFHIVCYGQVTHPYQKVRGHWSPPISHLLESYIALKHQKFNVDIWFWGLKSKKVPWNCNLHVKRHSFMYSFCCYMVICSIILFTQKPHTIMYGKIHNLRCWWQLKLL